MTVVNLLEFFLCRQLKKIYFKTCFWTYKAIFTVLNLARGQSKITKQYFRFGGEFDFCIVSGHCTQCSIGQTNMDSFFIFLRLGNFGIGKALAMYLGRGPGQAFKHICVALGDLKRDIR